MGQGSNGSRTPLDHSTYHTADTFDISSPTALHSSHSTSHHDCRSGKRQALHSMARNPMLFIQPRARQLQNPASIPVSICTPQPLLERLSTSYSHKQQGATTGQYTSRAAKYRPLFHKTPGWEKAGISLEKSETAPALGPCHMYD